MKKLFICESPFQIIVALYLKEQCCNQNDIVDILITDSFSNCGQIIDNIKKTDIFNKVYYYDIHYKEANKFGKYFIKSLDILFPKRILKKVFGKIDYTYHELYYWSSDYFTLSIRSAYAFKKNNLKAYVFEEGYISYFPFDDIKLNGLDVKIIEFRNKLFGIKEISRNNMDGIYLFEPELLIYKPSCKIFSIDRNQKISDKVRSEVIQIFEPDEIAKRYDKKFIIFEENRPEINDIEIYKNVFSIVGKDNVIVKTHPVRNDDRFSQYGVKVLGNDGIPWEALAFAGNFHDKIFISIGSGSITSYRILFGDNMKAYLLFKAVDSNNIKQFDEKYKDFWEKLEIKDYERGGIYMPESLESFYDQIKNDRGGNL